MKVHVIYYRRTAVGTMRRYEDTVTFDKYIDLLQDDEVIVKVHHNIKEA